VSVHVTLSGRSALSARHVASSSVLAASRTGAPRTLPIAESATIAIAV
jgi:hypothetical protein